ncbi:MAG: hypothetical protein ACXITR_13245 [Cyanobacterium sp.]
MLSLCLLLLLVYLTFLFKYRYLPRTNYVPACGEEEYLNRIPTVSWLEEGEGKAKKVTEYYRLVFRNMLPSGNERTLIGSIIPKKVTFINTCNGIAFQNERLPEGLIFSSLSFSIIFDFLVKISGKGLLATLLKDFPIIYGTKYDKALIVRCLTLTCLTNHYTELWESSYDAEFNEDSFTLTPPTPLSQRRGGSNEELLSPSPTRRGARGEGKRNRLE